MIFIGWPTILGEEMVALCNNTTSGESHLQWICNRKLGRALRGKKSEVAMWMRNLCLPIMGRHTLSLFISLLCLQSSSSTSCCLTAFISLHFNPSLYSYFNFFLIYLLSPHPHLRDCLSAQLDLPSFLSLCDRLRPRARPTPCLLGQLRGNKTEKTAEWASWVRNE